MENQPNNPSQEFQEKKLLIELESKAANDRHLLKMKEFAYLRETERLKHEWELERGRIKSAEIRKSQERKFSHR